MELHAGLEVRTADDGDVALAALIDSFSPAAPGGAEPPPPPPDFVLMDVQACAPMKRHLR